MCNEKQRFLIKVLNDIGFPGLAFLVMVYMCMITIEANTEAINRLSDMVMLID